MHGRRSDMPLVVAASVWGALSEERAGDVNIHWRMQ